MTTHIATLSAYALQTGGFRGVLLVRENLLRITSDVLPTLEAARYWTQCKAHEMYDERGYRIASVRVPGEYLANVWVNA